MPKPKIKPKPKPNWWKKPISKPKHIQMSYETMPKHKPKPKPKIYA